jgi:hypothetical protein
MFIPWQQFAASDILEVQGTDTVAQVRDQLMTIGGSAQHLSALVIHLPDGRVVPTVVAQLKELAKRHGRRMLPMRLEALTADLCPQPWEIMGTSNQFREAELLAARRRLPIVVTDRGERLGLVRPAREVESHRAGQGLSFDLFDCSVPGGNGIPFVWFSEQASLTSVARGLSQWREAALVYVLLKTADGRFKITTKRSLNQALGALARELALSPAEFWALPLGRLGTAFQESCQIRDLEDVSGTQAKNLSRSQALVLVRDGVPASLYPGGLRDTFSYSTETDRRFDLDTVPASILDGVSTGATTQREPARRDPEVEPRYVNLWFEDSSQRLVQQGQPLVVGRSYFLVLNVGRLLSASIIDWGRAPAGPEALVEPHAQEASLWVSLYSQDFQIPEPTQSFQLPREGDSSFLRLPVVPLHQSWGPGKAEMEVCLYYRTYLVQTFQVRVEVVGAGEAARTSQPQGAELIHSRAAGFPDMAQLPPRELSLTIARDGIDRYRLTFLVDSDLKAPDPDAVIGMSQAPRAVELSCHVQLTRDDLTHLITKARRQLYNVVQAFDLLQEKDVTTWQRAARALAQVGRQLYLALFAGTSARALGEWMEESLPDGSTIQIVDLAGDFVFPWSLVFTGKPWDDDRPVDVKQFWGWRYQLVILTNALQDTYRRAQAVVTPDDSLRVSVGLYERLVGAAAQKAFFASLAPRTDQQVAAEVLTSRREMGQALAAADRDLYYFFCHGYTERIATDIQLDADLVNHFAQMAAHTLDTRPQSVREHLDDLFDVSDSWLRLTRGKIPLTMLKETVPAQFTQHPVVFLNMCESAQVLPSLSDGFVPFFIHRGARAVVGTECSMNTVFADDFGRAFLTLFLQGETVGSALLALRRRYLEQGNPLALAYTLYADADLRLGRPLLPGPGSLSGSEGKGETPTGAALSAAVDALWEDDLDGLMLTLAARVQAGEAGQVRDELEMWDPPELAFAADREAGPEWTAQMIAFGQEWWDKLEPQLYDVLCNKNNEQHDDLVAALQDGVRMLAATLAPALVAQVAALPAIAVVVATIAAKKIAETGLEAVCGLWADSMANQPEDEQVP